VWGWGGVVFVWVFVKRRERKPGAKDTTNEKKGGKPEVESKGPWNWEKCGTALRARKEEEQAKTACGQHQRKR